MIPNVFHFVFGLRPQADPFHLVHYLCLESCRRVNQPERIYFHCLHEPWGEWWDRIRPHLTLMAVETEPIVRDSHLYQNTAEGRLIRQRQLDYAHESDFIRMKALQRYGGVYADMDTLFLKPLEPDWYQQSFVLGIESQGAEDSAAGASSLCNALMMARADSLFLSRWLIGMYEVFDGTWSRHSCQEATRLQGLHPDAVTVLPQRVFYRHGPDIAGVRGLFEDLDGDFSGMYSMHLWAHLWWDEWRTDFTVVHSGTIDEDYVRYADTTYAVAARQFLE